jgi:hypothetical protein
MGTIEEFGRCDTDEVVLVRTGTCGRVRLRMTAQRSIVTSPDRPRWASVGRGARSRQSQLLS